MSMSFYIDDVALELVLPLFQYVILLSSFSFYLFPPLRYSNIFELDATKQKMTQSHLGKWECRNS